MVGDRHITWLPPPHPRSLGLLCGLHGVLVRPFTDTARAVTNSEGLRTIS